MNTTDNEITFIYKSNKLKDREALAYAESMKDYIVKSKDLNIEPVTETQLSQIIDNMNIPVSGLVEKNSAEFQEKYGDSNLSDEDILKVLSNNTQFIKTPIIITKDETYFSISSQKPIK